MTQLNASAADPGRGRMAHKWQVLAIVCVGVFVASLDLFIVNIAFPDLRADFAGTSLASLTWILNAYAIVFAALLVPAGRWADAIGRKRLFLAGLATFTAASAACAAAPSVEALIAARAVQAVGAALLLPTSLALLLPEFSAQERPVAIGIWAAAGGVAAASGPVLGGLLVGLGWHWVFLVNVPVGLVALLAGSRILREARDPHALRPDTIGAIAIAGAGGLLVTAIVQAPEWGWTSTRTLSGVALAALLVAVLAARSRTHPAPIVEPALVAVRSLRLAVVAATFFFIAFAAMLLGAVLYLTGVRGEDALTAGLMVAPGPAAAALTSVPAARAGARFGPHVSGGAGALLFAAAAALWMWRLGDDARYATDFLLPFVLGGVGVGLVNPSLTAAAAASLPPGRFATGAALLTMGRQIGSALGVAVLVPILGPDAVGLQAADFSGAWALMAGASLAAAAALCAVGPLTHTAVAAPAALTTQEALA